MHHIDRGSQYGSFAYQKALEHNSIARSMSQQVNCESNAVVESFFSTQESELIHRRI